jgi:hypothetical protein
MSHSAGHRARCLAIGEARPRWAMMRATMNCVPSAPWLWNRLARAETFRRGRAPLHDGTMRSLGPGALAPRGSRRV